jgi:hypothetical protein
VVKLGGATAGKGSNGVPTEQNLAMAGEMTKMAQMDGIQRR